MTTPLNKGRATIEEVRAIQDSLYSWALEKGVGSTVAQKVVNCLDETFLLSLPRPQEKHFWPEHPGTRNWRYLCRRHISRLVGWTERISEGQEGGIPVVVDKFLREKQWPQSEDEPNEGRSKGAGDYSIEATASYCAGANSTQPSSGQIHQSTNRGGCSLARVRKGRSMRRPCGSRPQPYKRRHIFDEVAKTGTTTIASYTMSWRHGSWGSWYSAVDVHV